MKRKIAALFLTTLVAGTIAITATAPAQAYRDTTWGCPTCVKAPHHR